MVRFFPLFIIADEHKKKAFYGQNFGIHSRKWLKEEILKVFSLFIWNVRMLRSTLMPNEVYQLMISWSFFFLHSLFFVGNWKKLAKRAILLSTSTMKTNANATDRDGKYFKISNWKEPCFVVAFQVKKMKVVNWMLQLLMFRMQLAIRGNYSIKKTNPPNQSNIQFALHCVSSGKNI